MKKRLNDETYLILKVNGPFGWVENMMERNKIRENVCFLLFG